MSEDYSYQQQDNQIYDQNGEEEWLEYELEHKYSSEKPYNVYHLQQLIKKIYTENQEKCMITCLPPPWNLMLYSFCDFSSESLNNVIDQEQTGRRMIRFDESYSPQLSIGECFICCSETQLISNPCQHSFCLDCWAHHIENSHCNRSYYELFPMCPWQDCVYRTNILLMQKVWLEIPQLKNHFQKLLCLKYAQKSDRVRLCKKQGCNRALYINSGMENLLGCDCGNYICRICGQDDHFPLSCGDLMIWNKIVSENENHWASELVTQKCPMCKSLIDKNGGCIHMTCRCKYEFCWICLKVWKGHGSVSACNSVQKDEHEKRLQQEQIKRKLNQKQYLARFEEVKSQVERADKIISRINALDFRQLIKEFNDYHILTKDATYLKEVRDQIIAATQAYKQCQIYIFFKLGGYMRLEAMVKLIASQTTILDDYLTEKINTIDRAKEFFAKKQHNIDFPETLLIQQIQTRFFEGRQHHLQLLKSIRKLYEAIKAGQFLYRNGVI